LNRSSVLSLDADPVLAALAGDREALLQKLNIPSTDQLATAPSASDEQPSTSKKARVEDASPEVVEEPGASTSKSAAAAGKTDEDARPPSQNRSVTAVSLNNAPDSWLKAIWRNVFVSFFGAIFAPFRRRGKGGKK
jgi:hypothetical protein